MIIIYQIRSFEHTRQYYQELACPLEDGKGVTIVIRQKYVWWLGPMAPSVKYGMAYCDNRELIPASKWTKEIVARYKELKATTKTPLRLWRGMIVIPCIIAVIAMLGMIQKHWSASNEKTMTEYLEHPKVGDIYYASTGGTMVRTTTAAYATNDVYALFKVIKINDDSVFVVQGNATRVSTPEQPVNQYTSGFWDKLETATTSYNVTSMIISHQNMIQYKYFYLLPRNPDGMPGRITKVERPDK